MKTQFGELVTGDFEENTLTIEIDGEMVIQAGRYALVPIDDYNQLVKNCDLADVVNWLPFKRELANHYKQLAESGRLIKLYDDGTVIRHGEDEPIACVTHFREG